MDQRTRAHVASAAIVGIFLLVQLGALALVAPFDAAGYQAVENPQDPTNSAVYVLFILVATAFLLAAIKYGLETLIRLVVVASAAYISLFVLRLFVPAVVTVDLLGLPVNVPAVAVAAVLGVALWVYPEWYVVDAAGVLMGAGAAALFGISFGLLPALLLLAALAVYDAISVYGTEHMLTLASGVMDLKVPIVLVVPLSLSYSYLDAEMPDPTEESDGDGSGADASDEGAADTATDGDGEDGDAADSTADGDEAGAIADGDATDSTADGDAADSDRGAFERDALFIGLGDAIIPSVLVASAAFFAPEGTPEVALLGIEAAVPAVGAMIGTTAGLIVLLWMVLKGRAHAGLPLLNGGSIAGYLIGALATGMSLARALGIEQYL